MKLCALGLALFASTFTLPTALAAEHYAGSGFAGCSMHAGAPARDTVTLAALGAVVLLVVRRLLQASS